MTNYFALDYSGGDFDQFSAQHWIALAFIFFTCLLITLRRDHFSHRGKLVFRFALLILIYLCEGSWHLWKLATGSWNINVMLPLWVCSLTSWSMPILLIWKRQWYFEWAYTLGLIGAVMALLQPDLLNYGFPHFRFIEFFLLHGALVVAVVYFLAVEGYRPHIRAFPAILVFINVYWAFCALVNTIIGTSNYLYTHTKLPTPSLLDLLGPHPWYLLSMELIGIGLCLLLYLPYHLHDRRKNQMAPI
jgi:hypothetical integral membrane protein (TIGR02206 family)